MARLDRWAEPEYLTLFTTGNDTGLTDSLLAKHNPDENDSSSAGFVRASKELIFEVRDGKPVFHFIIYSINTVRGAIELSHVLETVPDEDEGDDDACTTLAIATAFDIPIYANEESDAPELIRLYQKMLKDGFSASDGKGGRVRLKITHPITRGHKNPDYVTQASLLESVSPVQMAVLGQAIASRISELERAERVLHQLDEAIFLFEHVLQSPKRDEEQLQRCITGNAVLFGVEYRHVVPKHRFGAEFDADYALETFQGLYELVELEASTLKLFTRNGRPRKELVHAEQQVLDWLDWIERHNAYACESLPGIRSPKGWVIIGRSESLSDSDLARLQQRNRVFRGQLVILTYDQLLERAKLLRQHLVAE